MPKSHENDLGHQIVESFCGDQSLKDLVLKNIQADATGKELELTTDLDGAHIQTIKLNSNDMCRCGMVSSLHPNMYNTKGEEIIPIEERGLIT